MIDAEAKKDTEKDIAKKDKFDLKKLFEGEFNIDEYLTNLTNKEKVELLDLLTALEDRQEANPESKFLLINKHQIEFLKCVKKFQLLFCGNQAGKTAVLVFKMLLMGKGLLKTFPHKPKRGKPLLFCLCGESNELIRDSIIPELQKWAKEGDVVVKSGSGGKISYFLIKNNGVTQTKVLCRSYEAGPKKITSYKFHAMFFDEPMENRFLEEALPRTTAHQAWLMCAMTKTPDHAGPKYSWMKEMYKGTWKNGKFHKEEKVAIIMASSYDNKTLSTESIDDTIAIHDPDSPTYRMRVEGIPDDLQGLVFPSFKPSIRGPENQVIPWHVGELEDFLKDVPDLRITHTYNVYGGLDYGSSKPFACLNIVVSLLTNTIWVVDEVYLKFADTSQQMRATKNMYLNWGFRPYIIACDDQTTNPYPDYSSSIMEDYENAIQEMKLEDNDNWETCLTWSRAAKKSKLSGLALITRVLNKINPLTNKPTLRILSKCKNFLDEVQGLLWSPDNSKGLTIGDDHALDGFQYWLLSECGYSEIFG